jgi:hypothetical protein
LELTANVEGKSNKFSLICNYFVTQSTAIIWSLYLFTAMSLTYENKKPGYSNHLKFYNFIKVILKLEWDK